MRAIHMRSLAERERRMLDAPVAPRALPPCRPPMIRPLRNLALATLLLLAANAASAQEDSLPPPRGTALMSGRVLDALTGLPVAGATVYIKELRRLTVTNEYGGFVLDELPEGTYTWSFRRLGYASWESESPVRDRDWFTVRILPHPEVLEGLTVVADGFELRRRRVNASVLALTEDVIASSGAGNAYQLLMSRGNMSIVPCGADDVFSCVRYRGQIVRPAVYLNDQPYPAGVRELGIFSTVELHQVEVLRWVGGVRIYLTTRDHAEQLARRHRYPDPFVLMDAQTFGAGNSLQPFSP
jgi:hypothetical protein